MHTKGPWIISEGSTRIKDTEVKTIGIYPEDGAGLITTIMDRAICDSTGKLNNNLDNANLIAAAPDMLEALKRVVTLFEQGNELTLFDREWLLYVISKAEGR